MERNILHHQYRSDQPVFKFFFFFSLCAGTNAIRKPVISPEPCQSDSLGEGSEENAGSHWANNDRQSHSKRLSNQGGRSGHRGLPSLYKLQHLGTCRHRARCQSISDSQHCLHKHLIPPPAFSGVVWTEEDRKSELTKGEGGRQRVYHNKCKVKVNTQITAQILWWHMTLTVPGVASRNSRRKKKVCIREYYKICIWKLQTSGRIRERLEINRDKKRKSRWRNRQKEWQMDTMEREDAVYSASFPENICPEEVDRILETFGRD